MTERPGRLEGKVAIVAGAGAVAEGIGNGRATAILFAREGAKVLLVGRTRERLAPTLEAIEAEGGEAALCLADVTRGEDCAAMVGEALERWGRLDILHNNVGRSGPGSVVEVEEERWDEVLRANVTSVMLACKHAIPSLADEGGGAIVNISSLSAIRPRGLTPYTTAKGAVIALTRALAIDHASQGIRANCIIVGPVYTPMVYARGISEEVRERRRRSSPLGIEGSGWDVGHAALYLASDEARYVTGVALPVDGGVHIASPARA